jgi:AraC-like DNA-binding protein
VLPPWPERLARQRRRYAEERIAVRVVELGFADVRAYLEDRLIQQEWLLVEVAAELGAHRETVRRLMQQTGVRRVRRTARQLAVGERGRRVQSVSWQDRRAARLEELGFADLGGYLQRRRVEQGWSIKRMRAELGVGRNWLVAQMAWLGLR